MTKFQKRLTTAIATGAVLVQALAPLASAETLTITNNGAGADSSVKVNSSNTTTVSQSNTANVTNNVDTKSTTGGNEANFNTGGDTTVDTGNAKVVTTVENTLNSNQASVGCCNAADPTSVSIDGNGAFSDSKANLSKSNTVTVAQSNDAHVTNNVDTKASTGDNEAGFNTGSGDVTVRTGDAVVRTNVSTEANANVAQVAPATGASEGTSLIIKNNGAGSENEITVKLPSSVVVAQNNSAEVSNNVDTKAETGDNAANFNTGSGDVTVDTGNAGVATTIDNMLNFNAAEVDCGCVVSDGLIAKIADNGAVPGFLTDSSNTIKATLDSEQVVAQGNGADLSNNIDGHHNGAQTGDNEVSKNTAGDPNSDPTVLTGDSAVINSVSNTANENILGSLDLPELPHFQAQFDLGAILSFFGLTVHM